jgi:hypothetical protein
MQRGIEGRRTLTHNPIALPPVPSPPLPLRSVPQYFPPTHCFRPCSPLLLPPFSRFRRTPTPLKSGHRRCRRQIGSRFPRACLGRRRTRWTTSSTGPRRRVSLYLYLYPPPPPPSRPPSLALPSYTVDDIRYQSPQASRSSSAKVSSPTSRTYLPLKTLPSFRRTRWTPAPAVKSPPSPDLSRSVYG